VGLCVGALASRAAEAAQTIPVLSEALTFGLAIQASHCGGVFCLAHHVNIIQLSLVVCQEKNASKLQLYFA
jgi:hypothetical protein